ncbi:MAG: DNA polymerase II large subunit [Candidatus Micrarchaeia archaeon]
MDSYFASLSNGLNKAFEVARRARATHIDPADEPEIKIAEDVAARVEALVGPRGVAGGIRALGLDRSREELAFNIAEQILEGKYGGGGKEELLNQAIRTGVALLTEGVLVAPTEGIAGIRLSRNPDGSDYLSLFYAGPIRSAGGTVAALSVVLADYARLKMGVADYRPTDSEVERYVEEISIYDARAARLQHKPSDDEIRLIVKNCPVCVDGDPTEQFEVQVHRDLPRVATNRIRGGIALVIAEGIAQKASKVLKITRKVGLNWSWLENLVKKAKKEGSVEVKPNPSFLGDVVAGRPIFAYPSAKGGFRLRYGRTRMTGIAAKALHPATMAILNDFPAIGTQLKLERPGKGCVVTPCDSIEGPVVLLNSGDVVRVESEGEARRLRGEVKRILFLGDLLVSYGDFLKSNHPLVPGAWCEEWWAALAEKAAAAKGLPPPVHPATATEAFSLSEKLGIPLHPRWTFFWHDVSSEQLKLLAEWLAAGRLLMEWFDVRGFSVEFSPAKEVLEELCVPHRVQGKNILLDADTAHALLRSLGMLEGKRLSLKKFQAAYSPEKPALSLISELAGVQVMPKAPTYIGGRMGRPEKARERKMEASPQVLFPIGNAGGKTRSIAKAFKRLRERDFEGKGVFVEAASLRCPACNTHTTTSRCPMCGSRALVTRSCAKCSKPIQGSQCACGGKAAPFATKPLNIVSIVEKARAACGFFPEELKGVRGMTSALKLPEPLEKGILRSKHDVFVFKDGTIRFDATNLPLTHFTPEEVGVPVERLRELGYTHDCHGAPLSSHSQLLELRPQDIILPESGADYLLRVAKFVDDELILLYGQSPFYNIASRDELVGTLVVTLSPHTSCGVLGRVVGFTKANAMYCHPYTIAARRRNADGDEDSIMLLMDALLNFSRAFLPESRGGSMDAPLILSSAIDPKEVDDEVHAMEVVARYPLEFYEACQRFASPSEAKLEKVGDRLGRPSVYAGLGFTHSAASIHGGPVRTAYVSLKSMKEKLEIQFSLTEKIRAADARDAAARVILSHFLPDLYGNLRSFSRQEFRCGDCNFKYRRVPLLGKCRRCGGKLLLTVNKGGIEKYLSLSREIAERYALPDYLKQRLALIEKDIASIFQDETQKQFNLADFM